MDIIRKLPPHISDLIAAGEVVQRPASVIKELIENSIDAHARLITVEIQNGGVTYMRVTDDGGGIGTDYAETAFVRHATSKIQERGDLDSIMTLGFRGEALAAIAAVSKIELITKTSDEKFGTLLRLEAGNVTEKETAGCPDGTTIIVRDLFFNTPARMKFLKKDTTESSNAAVAVFNAALSHPEVSVKFIKDGRAELSSPGGGSLYDCIYGVLGREFAASLIETNYSLNGMEISGYITKPAASHPKQNRQHFFVNGRVVKSRTMCAALEEAYKNSIMTGRHPGCVLHLTVKPELFDVNVHPAKTEVKFVNERAVFECVMFAAKSALHGDSGRREYEMPPLSPAVTSQNSNETLKNAGYAPDYSETEKHIPDNTETAAEYKGYMRDPGCQTYATNQTLYQTADIEYSEREEPDLTENIKSAAPETAKNTEDTPEAIRIPEKNGVFEPEFRIIGEAMTTYIIVESGNELLLIDKHAAHERIIFERLKNRTGEVMSQFLITPEIIDFTPADTAALLENTDKLQSFGFELSEFGGGSIIVRRVPSDIDFAEIRPSLEEIAASILDGKDGEGSDNILHTIACKAAIKAGRQSNLAELSVLVSEVLSRDDIKYCPHGRPVCVSLSRNSIEKQFGRLG